MVDAISLLTDILADPTYKSVQGGYKICHYSDSFPYVVLVENVKTYNPNAPLNSDLQIKAREQGVDTPLNIGRGKVEYPRAKPLSPYIEIYTVQEKMDGEDLYFFFKKSPLRKQLEKLINRPTEHYAKLVAHCGIINRLGGHCDQHSGNIFLKDGGFGIIDLMPALSNCPKGKAFETFLQKRLMLNFFNKLCIGSLQEDLMPLYIELARKLISAFEQNGIKVDIGFGGLEAYLRKINEMDSKQLLILEGEFETDKGLTRLQQKLLGFPTKMPKDGGDKGEVRNLPHNKTTKGKVRNEGKPRKQPNKGQQQRL